MERIVSKSLEKDRNLRYQHAADMRADLQRLKRGHGHGAGGGGQFGDGGGGAGLRILISSRTCGPAASAHFRQPALASIPSSSSVKVAAGCA
jgi:hypothetical protein